MMYPFMTLEDGTEIVHSERLENGRIKVYMEKLDEKYCFRHATCWLPDYTWEDIFHFSQEEIDRLQEEIASLAPSIFDADVR